MNKISLAILSLCLLPFLSFGQNSSKKYEPLINAAKKTSSDAIIVIQNGKKVINYHTGSEKRKIQTSSVTKSIVGLAIARLLAENKIDSLNTPVVHYYPEWRQGLKKNITIRHLTTHKSGLQNVPDTRVEIQPSPNILQLALCASVVDTPGTTYEYNNKAVNILPDIVEKVSGKNISDYLSQGLFKEMGITDIKWETDEAGNYYGMSALNMRANDLAKIGQLLLNNGSWQGEQLISKKQVDQLLSGDLMWYRIPKSKFIVGDEVIQNLKDANIEQKFINKIKTVKGTYDSQGALFNALTSQFNRNEFGKFKMVMHRKEIKPWKIEKSGEIIGYNARGDYGEYLYIYPEQDLVAVRMIDPTEDFNQKTDSFMNFGDMVYKLSKGS